MSALPGADLSLRIPPLHRWLDPVMGPSPSDLVPDPRGPRQWWPGPLDVEGLVLGSLQAAATALHRYPVPGPRFVVTSARAAASFDSLGHLRIGGVAPEGFAELSGFFRCRDGWVRLHANYPHHASALRSVLGSQSRGDITATLARRDAQEVETAVRGAGGVAAVVRPPDAWATSGPGAAVAVEPWIRFTSPAPDLSARHAAAALDKLRVVDLTRVIAGPSGTRLLGALGADVLRVDPPGMAELRDHYIDTGFAKRSALGDLADPRVLEQFHALLQDADVLFLGYRGSALARLGLDQQLLAEQHPQLVVVTLDAWGDRGPWAGDRGFDSIVQAATGIAHLYGHGSTAEEFRPGALPVQALDHATGYGMVAAALALLGRRCTTGVGGGAHLSLARTALELLALPAPFSDKIAMNVPMRTTVSVYGTLRHVPPPLDRSGDPLEYPSPPPLYGSSPLAWRSEPVT